MRMRRGTDFWSGDLGAMVHQFKPGDLVTSVIADSDTFIGSVREVDARINKVMVAWGAGSVVQHDPDEIMLSLHQTPEVMQRMSQAQMVTASRRMRSASADKLWS